MRLGIIGAMEVEVAHLIEVMDVESQHEQASLTFYQGKLRGADVVVVQCGIGKVNAALCTQILIDKFDVDAVINTGVAGSLNNEIEIGDLVVSVDAVHHDMDVSILGYAKGEVPGLNQVSFVADVGLAEAVEKAACELDLGLSVFKGRVASGEQFIADDAKKQEIAAMFDALCCEMEGASIAQVATLNHIPFVIVRAISDKADGSKQVMYPVFEAKAAHDCACIIEKLAEQYA